ncbi:hypothetical protein KI387_003260 [Taxus chinensis]|uniref:Uncharacterized protein n=1 Tax=Taxus chinensis TaxID=29808 RepID=A0AA38GYP6_TAXCH|nr:hypothetical protein KI387_003260 [Taxus chinensis]
MIYFTSRVLSTLIENILLVFFGLSEEITGPLPHNENTVLEAKWIYEQVFGSLAVRMRAELQHIEKLEKEVVNDIAKEHVSTEAAEKEEKTKLKMFKNLNGLLTIIDDIDTKYNLHFPPDEVEVKEGQIKRPKHKSMYSICHKSGVGVVSRNFGITSEQLGKNLLAMYKRHEVEDASNTPEVVAVDCFTEELGDPQYVLKGARHMGKGTRQAASENHVIDPLDDIRIHPDSYELANKMAENVYCEDATRDIDDMNEETQEMAVEQV